MAALVRMRRHVLLALLLAAIAIAGCSLGGDTANGGLGGTSWTAVTLDGQPTLAQARPTIRFTVDGTVSGTTGCNQFSGPFRTDGGTIVVGELAATKIGCDGERGDQEHAFLAALGGARAWNLTATGDLEIEGGGRITLRPG